MGDLINWLTSDTGSSSPKEERSLCGCLLHEGQVESRAIRWQARDIEGNCPLSGRVCRESSPSGICYWRSVEHIFGKKCEEFRIDETCAMQAMRVEQMLPNYTPLDRQQFVEELDRTAYAASGGLEEEYVRRVTTKLKTVQKKLAKQQAQAQTQAQVQAKAQNQPPIQAQAQGLQPNNLPIHNPPMQTYPQQQVLPGAQGMNRSGSSTHSGGSTRGINSQHEQLLRQQQQNALWKQQQAAGMGQQAPHYMQQATAITAQTPWNSQPKFQSRPPLIPQQQYQQQFSHQPLGMHEQQQQRHAMMPQAHLDHQPQLQHHSLTQLQSQPCQLKEGPSLPQGIFKQFPKQQQQQHHHHPAQTSNNLSGGMRPQGNQHYQFQAQPPQVPQAANPFHMPEFSQGIHNQNRLPHQNLQPVLSSKASDLDDHFHASPSMKQMIHGLLLDPEQNRTSAYNPQLQMQTQPQLQKQQGQLSSLNWRHQEAAINQAQQANQASQYQTARPASELHQRTIQAARGAPGQDMQHNYGQSNLFTGVPQPLQGQAQTKQPQAPAYQVSQVQVGTGQHQGHLQAGSFMGMLTGTEPAPSNSQQSQISQASSNPFQPENRPASGNSQAGFLRPLKGSADDYTARYWDLLKKAQKDMIPVFDRFKVTMERLTGQQKEEKLLKKMAGIYNILPRLKIQPSDGQYKHRVWTKQEFDQLQVILHQLYPYCRKLNMLQGISGPTGSPGLSPGATSPAVLPQQIVNMGGSAQPQMAFPSNGTQTQTQGLPVNSSAESTYSQGAANPFWPAPQLQDRSQHAIASLDTDQINKTGSQPTAAHSMPLTLPVAESSEGNRPMGSIKDRLAAVLGNLQKAGSREAEQVLEQMLSSSQKPPVAPPKHLLNPQLDAYRPPKVSLKRKQADAGRSDTDDVLSPLSVLDPFPDEPRKRSGSLGERRDRCCADLEIECQQVKAEAGMMVCVGGADEHDRQPVIHIAPSQSQYQILAQSVHLPNSLPDHWKVLTVKPGQTSVERANENGSCLQNPSLTFHYSQLDGLHYEKAEAAHHILEANLEKLSPPLKLQQIVTGWHSALTMVQHAFSGGRET